MEKKPIYKVTIVYPNGNIEKDEVDMDAKMVYVEDLLRITRKCSFRKLLEKQHSKMEKIVTFLIILENGVITRFFHTQTIIIKEIWMKTIKELLTV